MSFARGFIKGFIGQSLDKKAAADAALADLNSAVAERYLTEIQPNFIKNENNIEKRFNLIDKKYDRPTALYALSNKLTDTDYGFRQIMDLNDSDAAKLQKYTNTIDFGNFNFEQAKNTRALNYNEKYEGVTNQIKTMAGGSGPSVTELLIPYDETMGASTFDAGSLQGLREITSSGGSTRPYDFDTDAADERAYQRFFVRTFTNQMGQFSLNVTGPKEGLAKFVLEGYDEAVKNGYNKGEFAYAQERFVESEFEKRGIEYGVAEYKKFLTKPKVEEQNQPIVKGNVNQQTSKVFDPESIGLKEDVKINIKSRRAGSSQFNSPAQLINELRENIALEFESTASDQEKQEAIAKMKQFARDELKKMGLNPNDFNL
jgi:hypothetical protein